MARSKSTITTTRPEPVEAAPAEQQAAAGHPHRAALRRSGPAPHQVRQGRHHHPHCGQHAGRADQLPLGRGLESQRRGRLGVPAQGAGGSRSPVARRSARTRPPTARSVKSPRSPRGASSSSAASQAPRAGGLRLPVQRGGRLHRSASAFSGRPAYRRAGSTSWVSALGPSNSAIGASNSAISRDGRTAHISPFCRAFVTYCGVGTGNGNSAVSTSHLATPRLTENAALLDFRLT